MKVNKVNIKETEFRGKWQFYRKRKMTTNKPSWWEGIVSKGRQTQSYYSQVTRSTHSPYSREYSRWPQTAFINVFDSLCPHKLLNCVRSSKLFLNQLHRTKCETTEAKRCVKYSLSLSIPTPLPFNIVRCIRESLPSSNKLPFLQLLPRTLLPLTVTRIVLSIFKA